MAAANFSMLPDKPSRPTEGDLVPSAEICLVYSEPVYRYDGGGSMVKGREPGQFRFHVGAAGLRQFIELATEWADTMDKMAAKFGEADEPAAGG